MPTSALSFAAIDFETADYGRDSACSVGIVRVLNGEIVSRFHRLIKPPRSYFRFTHLHGIAWSHVADQPCFAQLWPELGRELEDVPFVVAHNASFDRSVLNACCMQARINPPQIAFRCTVQMARTTWKLRPTKLSDVCRYLNIPLTHHRADSDAEACARIVLAATRTASKPEAYATADKS